MSVFPTYLSPAATSSSMTDSPLAPQPAGASGEDVQSRLRADIERTLLKISQDLYELEVCAGDVTAGQEDRVPLYMQEINKGLIQLNEMAGRMEDTVPQQVVDYIDNYRNPHMYTRSALSRATGENQYALGRVLGLESFRRQLEESIGTDFPSIPLPQRRHQPIINNGTTNGEGTNVDHPNPTNEIKTEEAQQTDQPSTTNGQITNGTI